MSKKPAKKRRRANPEVSSWVQRYLIDRIPPPPGSEAFKEFQSWYFFGQDVVGLPDDWHAAIPHWQKWDELNGR